MSIADKITQLTTIRGDIRTALAGKGVTATDHDYADFAADIGSIGEIVLPPEYQKVDYLTSTGTQRIESGIINDTLNIPIYYETNGISFSSVSSRQLIGSQGGFYFGPVNGYMQLGSAGTSNTGISINANTWYSVKARFTGVPDTQNNGKISFSTDNNVWVFGTPSSGIQAIATNVANNFNICLFSLNEQTLPASCSIKDFIIWKNDILVRHFVPCYRKSDNEIGMYDIVNNQFYTNAGTGSFTCYPAPPTT